MLHATMTALLFAVAITSTVCARMTRPDRNYYPMQRVLWSILGFGYGGGALALLVNGEAHQSPVVVRVAGTAVVLGGTLYSIYFMKRRNLTPRFIPIDAAGQPRLLTLDDQRQAHQRTVSFLGHGAMPADWVAEIDAAREKWQGVEDFRMKHLPAQVRERREAKERE